MRPSGRQVTPHLHAFFRTGVSCDSSPSRTSRVGVSSDSPSRAFHAGASDPIAFARFVNRKMSSTHKAAADEGLLSCEL